MYRVGTQLCYIIRCYTTYQLHVSATLLGHHQAVLSLPYNTYMPYIKTNFISDSRILI